MGGNPFIILSACDEPVRSEDWKKGHRVGELSAWNPFAWNAPKGSTQDFIEGYKQGRKDTWGGFLSLVAIALIVLILLCLLFIFIRGIMSFF